MAQYRTKLYDRLDRICFDYYGSTDRRIVEKVIDANPGVEEYPILLPIGILIDLPTLETATTAVQLIPQIKLWD